MEDLLIREDFFETDTMIWIENNENGVLCSNLIIKLLLKTDEFGGLLLKRKVNRVSPMTNEDMSTLFNIEQNVIDDSVELLEKIGVIKTNKLGVRYINYSAFK